VENIGSTLYLAGLFLGVGATAWFLFITSGAPFLPGWVKVGVIALELMAGAKGYSSLFGNY
jgi:hypothetical protein